MLAILVSPGTRESMIIRPGTTLICFCRLSRRRAEQLEDEIVEGGRNDQDLFIFKFHQKRKKNFNKKETYTYTHT